MAQSLNGNLIVSHETFNNHLGLGNLTVSLNLVLQGCEPRGLPQALINNLLLVQRTLRSLYNHYLWGQGTIWSPSINWSVLCSVREPHGISTHTNSLGLLLYICSIPPLGSTCSCNSELVRTSLSLGWWNIWYRKKRLSFIGLENI